MPLRPAHILPFTLGWNVVQYNFLRYKAIPQIGVIPSLRQFFCYLSPRSLHDSNTIIFLESWQITGNKIVSHKIQEIEPSFILIMIDWYLYALGALVLFGIQRFLYKVAAEENCDSALTTFSFMATVTLFGASIFLATGRKVENLSCLFIVSLVNSLSFFAGTTATIETLRRMPATSAMPIIRLNTAFVVLFGIFYFGDNPSTFQYLGIALSISVILLLVRLTQGGTQTSGHYGGRHGLPFALSALLAGTVAAVTSAFAALYVDKLAFIALSYFMGTIFSLVLYRIRRTPGRASSPSKSLSVGVMIGLINFGGFYSLLAALERGPLSIIASVTGLYFVPAVLLSVVFYREKMDMTRALALVMTVIAIGSLRL